MWHDAGWCQALGTSLLQAWHFVFKPILADLADCCGSIASVLDSSWLWQISNLLLCFCESIWIQADCSRSISMCFLWIFADLSWLLQFSLLGCKQIKLPALPSLQKFQTFLQSMGVRWVIFPWSSFRVTVPFCSYLQEWFPLVGLPWIPPYLGLKCLGPLPTLKAPLPKLIYWQWV